MQVLLLIFQHDTSVLIPGNMSVFIYIINIHVVTIIHSCTVYIYIYIYINYYTFLKLPNIGLYFSTSNCPFGNIIDQVFLPFLEVLSKVHLWSGYCHVAFGADQSTQFPPFHGLTLL